MGNKKGDRRERELRTALRERGFVIVRVAGSGSSPDDDLPDLLVGDGFRIWALEVKASTPEKLVYLSEAEVDALLSFCDGLHPVVEPRVALRWDYDTTWYLRDPRDLYQTDSGNYRAKSAWRDEWTTLDEVAPVVSENSDSDSDSDSEDEDED